MKNKLTKTKALKFGMLGQVTNLTLVAPVLASASTTYTVKDGDTLSQIAEQHQTTVDALVGLNNIENANLIHVGQEIQISTDTEAPQSQTSQAPQTSSGLSEQDAAAKEIIAQRESGGSYTAQNGQYYGRYQLTLSYLNGDLSPENQERVADAYVVGRYGSWSAALAFWNINGWY